MNTPALYSVDVAMLIDAIASRGDPLTRFVRSLPDDEPVRARSCAEDTIRLRAELVQHTQGIVTSADPNEAAAHAQWLTQHAHEAAYRWSSLLRAAKRWCELDTEAFVVRIGGKG